MPVLYGGVSDIEGLIQRVRDTNWGDIIVVDSAHCIEPTIESDYIFFSFHPIKPLTMSCGGLLSTDDERIAPSTDPVKVTAPPITAPP